MFKAQMQVSREELNSVIFTITQSLISLLVIGGGGAFVLSNPQSDGVTAAVGLMGVVLAFYFGQAINNSATNNAIKMNAAQNAAVIAQKAP